MELAIGHFGHASIAIAIFSLFSYQTICMYISLAFVSFSSLLFFFFSFHQARMHHLASYPSIADGKSGSWNCEHLFSCSKVNFSSLLFRQASRIMPTLRGFDGSLFHVLRTCENKNIAFLGCEADAALFTRLCKENFRNIFAKCSSTFEFSDLANVIVCN